MVVAEAAAALPFTFLCYTGWVLTIDNPLEPRHNVHDTASVEIDLGVLEDRALQRAETWPNGSLLQSNYLAQQAGKVHMFRQRVKISNVDPSAYQ